MADIEKEIEKEEKKVEKFFHKKENIWMSVSIVLAVILVISLGFNFSGKSISKDAAGNKAVDFIKTSFGADVSEFTNVTDLGKIYEITVPYQGQDIPVYMTKDGKYFISSAIDIAAVASTASNTATTAKEVPKTDKPKVELYIWGYCPYGVAAQGPLAEVANLLKNSADFEAVLYYAGHGDHEVQQNKIQACIQKLAKDKYWNYAAGFVKTIYPKCGGDIVCDKNESVALMKSLGIDSAKVMSCVDSEGVSLTEADSLRASDNGVTGSPTLMINGVVVNVASRTAEAYKTAVCNAFNNAPSECSSTLSSSSSAAQGNC